MTINWLEKVEALSKVLCAVEVTGADGGALDPNDAFAQLKELTETIKREKNTIYFVGNGASASMASHISADLEKNYHVRTEVFTDLSLITAIANDISYDQVFAEPLRRKMAEGDMLVAISSSGGSPNILNAADQAQKIGSSVITMSGMKDANPLRGKGALNFWVPALDYGTVETCHAGLLHFWVDLMTDSLPA